MLSNCSRLPLHNAAVSPSLDWHTPDEIFEETEICGEADSSVQENFETVSALPGLQNVSSSDEKCACM